MGLVAAVLWVQIFRLAIIPSLSGHMKPASMSSTDATKPVAPAKDPNEVIRSLMNSNEDLRHCLEKINPDDPLGMSGDSAEHTAQRDACLEKYQK